MTQKVKVLRLSAAIPNDPLVLRRDLQPDVRARLVTALTDLTRSEEGRNLLRRLYPIEGLAPVGDQDYEVVRQMVSTLGLDLAQLLRSVSSLSGG